MKPQRGGTRLATVPVVQPKPRFEQRIELGAREIPPLKHLSRVTPIGGRLRAGGALRVGVSLLGVGEEKDGLEGVGVLEAAGDEGVRQVGGAGVADVEHDAEEVHRRTVGRASGAGADHAELTGRGRVVPVQVEADRAPAADEAGEAGPEAVRLAVVLEEVATAEGAAAAGDGEGGGDVEKGGVGGAEDGGGEEGEGAGEEGGVGAEEARPAAGEVASGELEGGEQGGGGGVVVAGGEVGAGGEGRAAGRVGGGRGGGGGGGGGEGGGDQEQQEEEDGVGVRVSGWWRHWGGGGGGGGGE